MRADGAAGIIAGPSPCPPYPSLATKEKDPYDETNDKGR